MIPGLCQAIETLEALSKQGVKVKETLRFLKNKSNLKTWHYPFFLQLHINKKCNLRCKHCYYEDYDESSILKPSEVLKLINDYNKFLNKIGEYGMIYFSGGEPLLDPNLLKYVKKASKLGLYVLILSNGTLINKKVAQYLAKAGATAVQVSLEGLEKTNDLIRGKGSFKKASNGLKNCVKAGLKTTVMTTISRLNMNEIEPLINHCIKLKVNLFAFGRLVPTGIGSGLSSDLLTKDENLKLFKRIKKCIDQYDDKIKITSNDPLWRGFLGISNTYGCCVGTKGICVVENGDIMPCRRLNSVIGNIREDTLMDVWNSDYLQKFRDRIEFTGKCGECNHLMNCGGCRAIAKAVNGSEFSEDPQCFINNK